MGNSNAKILKLEIENLKNYLEVSVTRLIASARLLSRRELVDKEDLALLKNLFQYSSQNDMKLKRFINE